LIIWLRVVSWLTMKPHRQPNAVLPVAFLACIVLTFCKGPKPDDGKTHHATFETGTIPGLSQFERLNERELDFDSIMVKNVKAMGQPLNNTNDFLHNRSRIYVDSDPHNKILGGDTGPDKPPIPMPCHCNLMGDTLQVSMILGFFGGVGFELRLYKDQFRSKFLLYTDDVKPFKAHLSDTAFTSELRAVSKFQYLLIDKKPTYKAGQQLTGYFTLTSNRFYEFSGEKMDSSYVTAKIYFICNVR
jgi:hypothetical protein